ncbi:toll/interleukin-1 receptor domain-containing protein [Wenjunlia tyrosinilytica]|uniref:TIR domain-containing protein n=1 Tax=Wenjunlia tyrosinilytica TaxID=1544741 RepID=A0A918E0M9_9ACTN|nr:toll/interleukin-1 receptor domain-containing protein [Wenjunlia tyrosinilytica]GGO95082.1 hypothetical protein GCM10012280_51480 [Wenjunlia tyrosinilytica]
MEWANLVTAVASAAAAVATTYFGYLTVRHLVPFRMPFRRRTPAPGPAPEPGPDPAAAPDGSYDAFISHAREDTEQAERLATDLRERGLRVFLAGCVGLGLVRSLEQERALLGSANGVLVFSRATMADPAVQDEYAALLDRVHSGGRRLVPVRIDDAALPPLAGIRVPLKLAAPGTDEYDEQMARLVLALCPPRPPSGA